METSEDSFSFGPAHIHFRRFGTGAKILIAFHGFGQTGQNMLPIARKLGSDYTLICFDLFFHGNSIWAAEQLTIEPAFWTQFFKQWLERENIGRFSLLGYSLGCKFLFHSLMATPEKVDTVWLLAPDGLNDHPLYKFAVNNPIGQKVLKELVTRPHSFFWAVTLLSTFRLVNKSLLKFAASQMNTREKRWRVYNSWIAFRRLGVEPLHLAETINRNSIAITIYLGKYDKVITRKAISELTANLPDHKLLVIESGHSDIIDRTARQFAQNTTVFA